MPVVIDATGIIIAGHTRYKASKKLKLKEIPCIIADDLTPEQIKAFRLADNKVAEFSTWDFDLLNLELNDLDMDLSDFGFLQKSDDILDKELKDLSNTITSTYEVIIECDNETMQQDIYNQLTNEGLMCRVLTL